MSDALALSSFPQSGQNRSRSDGLTELAEYAGKQSDQGARARAGRAWDAAVREFNNRPWKFNRLVTDVTLVSATSAYTIATDWRNPLRACLLDASNKEVDDLRWVEFTDRLDALPSELGTSVIPLYYTARNIHETGEISYWPPIATTASFTYPKVRHYYHRRILTASGEGDRLNVPQEVDDAIFQLALAKFLHKERGGAVNEYILARDARRNIEREWGDWRDYLREAR